MRFCSLVSCSSASGSDGKGVDAVSEAGAGEAAGEGVRNTVGELAAGEAANGVRKAPRFRTAVKEPKSWPKRISLMEKVARDAVIGVLGVRLFFRAPGGVAVPGWSSCCRVCIPSIFAAIG